MAVDLYAQQIGSRLEDVASFAKYLGGSSGNVAFGTAIQGLKSAMLARVGDEHNGRFLRETLNRAGVDTEYLITDKSRLTALVMLGIKDQETFPLIFYRDNCADMALTPDDISEEYIASSRALAVTGTHLSHANTRAAVLKALEDEMVDGLSRGEIVRLGNIGTFQVGLRSRGAEKAEDFKAANISKARVNFRPGPVLADAMKTLNFSKVSTRAAQKGDGGGDGDIVDDPTA